MNSGQFVGRVGGLAVALGVGAAVFTGSGVAWATEDSGGGAPTASGSTSETTSETTSDSTVSAEDTTDDPDDDEDIAVDITDDEDLTDDEAEESAPSVDDEVPVDEAADDTSARKKPSRDDDPAAETGSVEQAAHLEPADDPADIATVTVNPLTAESPTTTLAPPTVPSGRPWPTAFDLRSAVTYVVDLATSFVDALFHPFAAGAPTPPTAAIAFIGR